MNYDLNAYRSINYYENISSIKAIYRINENMMLKDRYTPIDNMCRMGLKQIRLRCMENYIITSFDENLNMKQLADLIKYLHKADYLTMGAEIMIEDEGILISSLRNNPEIVCHY
jgi:hypothetical protein